MKRLLMFVAAAVVTGGFAAGGEPAQPNEHLLGFRPFIGAWRYEGPLLHDITDAGEKGKHCVVEFSWRWILDKQVIMRDWSVRLDGGPTLSGKGLTGWNAAEEKIMGGGMSSTGGMGIGSSVIDGKTITSTSEGVDASGTTSSTKIVITKKDKDTLTWQAVERTGGDIEGPTPVYEFKRVQRSKGRKAARKRLETEAAEAKRIKE